MNNKQNNKISLRKNPFFLVGLFALICMAASAFLLFNQLDDGRDHVSGRLISLEGNTIFIKNARGVESRVVISPLTKRNKDIESVTPGVLVRASGKYNEEGFLEAEGIRFLQDRKDN